MDNGNSCELEILRYQSGDPAHITQTDNLSLTPPPTSARSGKMTGKQQFSRMWQN